MKSVRFARLRWNPRVAKGPVGPRFAAAVIAGTFFAACEKPAAPELPAPVVQVMEV